MLTTLMLWNWLRSVTGKAAMVAAVLTTVWVISNHSDWAILAGAIMLFCVWRRASTFALAVSALAVFWVPPLDRPFPIDWKGYARNAGHVAGQKAGQAWDKAKSLELPDVPSIEAVAPNEKWLAQLPPEARQGIEQVFAGRGPQGSPVHPQAVASDIMTAALEQIDESGKRLALTQASMTDFQPIRLKPFFRQNEKGEFIRDPKATPPVYRQVIKEVVDEQSGEKKKVWDWIIDPTITLRPDLPVYASFRLATKLGMSSNIVPIEQYQPDKDGVWGYKRGSIYLDTIEKVVEQPALGASEQPKTEPKKGQVVAAAHTSSAKAAWPTKPHPKTDTVTVKPGKPQKLEEWTWSQVIADQGDHLVLVFDQPDDYKRVMVRSGSRPYVALQEVHPEGDKWVSKLGFDNKNEPEAPLGLLVSSGSEVSVEVKPAVS